MSRLIPPYGGELKDLCAAPPEFPEGGVPQNLPCVTLNARHLCDAELLLNGGFSPLDGFMIKADYDQVVDSMRLADGTLWPMPVVLDVSSDFAASLEDEWIELRDAEGVLIAYMQVASCWQPDKTREAESVYGSSDAAHPAVDHLFNRTHEYYLGGRLFGVSEPLHYDFRSSRFTPAQLRGEASRVVSRGRVPDAQSHA